MFVYSNKQKKFINLLAAKNSHGKPLKWGVSFSQIIGFKQLKSFAHFPN